MKIFLFIILIGIITSLRGYSQSKKFIYVDQHGKVISHKEFNKKIKSRLFIARLSKDRTTYKKLYALGFFGNLNTEKKSQLNKLFHKRFGIDSTKIWMIFYRKTLLNSKKMPLNSGIMVLDSTSQYFGKVITKKIVEDSKINKLLARDYKWVISYVDNEKYFLNKKNRYKKIKNVNILNFYSIDKGYFINQKKMKWLKDYNLITRKLLTNNLGKFDFLILYPDGNFVTYNSHTLLYFKEEKLLKFKSFKKFEKKWRKRYKKYNAN